MSVRAAVWTLLFVVLTGSATASTGARQEPAREWRFRVLLDDTEIGYHNFRLTEQAGEVLVDSEARFKVRFLFFDAFRYEHVNRERWDSRCLIGIDAVTEVNGKTLSVSGARDGQAFMVEAGEGSKTLDDCVMTFAYWDPRFLEQGRLLNSQTGDYVDVTIRRVGEEDLAVRGRNVTATRYALAADKLNMDLWYSPDLEWLGLESITKGGRTLRYELL